MERCLYDDGDNDDDDVKRTVFRFMIDDVADDDV
jgi:hypothetical protein